MFRFPKLALTAITSVALSLSAHADVTDFDKSQLHQHISTLASDRFEGRGPLTEGERLSVDYIEQQFKAIGLEPGYHGSYLQSVPLAKVTADQNMSLTLGNLSFINGPEYTARSNHIADKLKLKDSEMVFVGYGINAPEYGWNDYQDVDVRGKTVVMLVNDPGFATQDPNFFKGNAMTYYGRWTYKYEEASKQGAAAAIIIHKTDAAGYPWSVVENSNTGSKYTLVDDNNNLGQVDIMAWLHQDAAKRLFKNAKLDFAKLSAAAAKPGFKAVPMNQQANLEFAQYSELAESKNLVGMIKGAQRPDEAVVIHAHWDHLGKQGGEGHIYNGAIDNATGVAGVLELARTLKAIHAKKPFARSIYFTSFTAEETGMIGAQQFAEQPPVATKNIAAFLNIDGMNVGAPLDYVLRYGNGVSELELYLDRIAKDQNRYVKPDPRPQAGLLYRSDHFALFKQGIPGLLFMSLGDNDPDYIPNRYHKPADDYDPSWPLDGMVQDLQLMSTMAQQLAYGDDWPKWLEDSEFKQRRAQDGR